MIDPQNQANSWIKAAETPNGSVVLTLSDKRFRMELERTMMEGIPLLIQHIEEEVDPVLDPVLNKNFVGKPGRRKERGTATEEGGARAADEQWTKFSRAH